MREFPRPSDGRGWPPGRVRVETSQIVAGAWDFERINHRYARHLKVLAERPGGALCNLKSVICNPAKRGLPGWILPSDYLGQPAWRSEIWELPFEIQRSVEPAGNCARSTPNSCPAKLCCICNKSSPCARTGMFGGL